MFSVASGNGQRIKYNFNPGWSVKMGDEQAASENSFPDDNWRKVTLPFAWNEDEAFKKDIAELSTGISWYRKHFRLPAFTQPKKIFIEFEGIRQAGEIFINGVKAGSHENGVTAFGFDITDYVRSGEDNVIAVRVDNNWDYKEKATGVKYQWEDKNFNANYGGITKNVFLHVTGPVYQTLPLFTTLGTTGVYIYADQFDIPGKTATIHAESEVKNATTLRQEVEYRVRMLDAEKKVIKTFSGDKIIIDPGETKVLKSFSRADRLHFWSWGYGYLYEVQTLLIINGKPTDTVSTLTGFRKTAFKEGMIFLNDRVIQVHGYAQRTTNEWPAIGQSVPAWLSDYSNGLMVEGNANMVRWMHITPWKQDIESCDRVGLMQAMPAGDAERDVEGRRWEQRKEVMRDAIIYNRNNPSIIFYECGNESISEGHMTEMKVIRDKYDPHGGRAIGSREMLDSKVAEYGGEMLYINKSAHIPLWAMEYSRDEGLRKYWDDYSPPYHKDGDGPMYRGQPAPEYNRNQESHAIENIKRWYDYWKERPGTGNRVSSGGVNIVFSETNTHHRGAENYRRSGEVDALRIYKENYFANQVMWNGWVDVENPGIHIIGHWNYAKGVQKDIYVVSSAAKVELFINGKSMGWGTNSYGFLYTFKNIKWEPGSITAKGYDKNGKLLCSTKKKTAGEPVALHLKLITGPGGLKADGQDLVLVEVEALDKNGQRCPTAMNKIHFDLKGPSEWRGGMGQGPGNYILSKDLPLECGVNRVLVRSTVVAGDIYINASAAGLSPASVHIKSIPFQVKNGLSVQLPSSGLPSYLKKGETPGTPSFKQTRETLTIVNAVAGANTDSCFASFDDNELSDWANDGRLSTAWIEYELEKTAPVSEINLKLNNFRTRSYPLRITVDGKEVFKDTTQKSLGYITIAFSPVNGKKVKIQLLEPSRIKQDTGTEVSGKKLDDGVSRNNGNARGLLSIIEAEIYSLTE